MARGEAKCDHVSDWWWWMLAMVVSLVVKLRSWEVEVAAVDSFEGFRACPHGRGCTDRS